LDNPWFTVNQRGQTTYENPIGNVYCFDRWRTGIPSEATQGEFKVVQNSDGSINLVNESSVYCNFVQPLENDFVKRIHGKTVTLSIRFVDDTILYNSGVVDASIDSSEITVRIGEGTVLNIRTFGDMRAAIQIVVKREITVSNIKAIKLELGSVSTLAMDTAPNYAEELLKCQRYFQRINFSTTNKIIGFSFANANKKEVYTMLPIPTTMRNTPTVGISDITKIKITPNTTWHNSQVPTRIYIHNIEGVNCHLTWEVTNDFTAGEGVLVQSTDNVYINLSADL